MSVASESAAIVEGTVISDKYRVVECLREAPFVTVFRVENLVMGSSACLTALRTPVSERAALETFFAGFEAEFSKIALLDHENIVRVMDFGTFDERAYFVTGLEGGVSLYDLKQCGTVLPLEKVLQIMNDMTAGLTAAHHQGVLHGDLQPASVLLFGLTDQIERCRVTDFAISKVIRGQDSTLAILTRTGHTVGSPYYMSPEVFRGKPGDIQSDIYSLGVILYELLSGRVPFRSESMMDLLLQHLNESPEPLDTRPNGDPIPEQINEIIMRSLAKNPAERFESVWSFAEAFREAVESLAEPEPAEGAASVIYLGPPETDADSSSPSDTSYDSTVEALDRAEPLSDPLTSVELQNEAADTPFVDDQEPLPLDLDGVNELPDTEFSTAEEDEQSVSADLDESEQMPAEDLSPEAADEDFSEDEMSGSREIRAQTLDEAGPMVEPHTAAEPELRDDDEEPSAPLDDDSFENSRFRRAVNRYERNLARKRQRRKQRLVMLGGIVGFFGAVGLFFFGFYLYLEWRRPVVFVPQEGDAFLETSGLLEGFNAELPLEIAEEKRDQPVEQKAQVKEIDPTKLEQVDKEQVDNEPLAPDAVVKVPQLGVALQFVTDALAKEKKLVRAGGLYVTEVLKDGPAWRKKFKKGDVIRRYEDKGEPVLKWKPQEPSSLEQFLEMVSEVENRKGKLTVLLRRGRAGKDIAVVANFGK